jgi:hypothetical protein
MTEIFRNFSQFLQANATIVPQHYATTASFHVIIHLSPIRPTLYEYSLNHYKAQLNKLQTKITDASYTMPI